MSGLVLAFAGHKASGKTALTTAVAESLGWPRVAFGDYVRQVARERGLGASADVLQDLGAALIEEQGWDQFCRATLAQAPEWQPGHSLVVDGVRHAEALAALRSLVTPARLMLLYLELDATARATRLHLRGGLTRTLDELAAHSTEIQVATTLPQLANLVLDGRRSVPDLTREIVAWVASRC